MAELRQQFRKPTFLYMNEYFNEEQFGEWLPIKGTYDFFLITFFLNYRQWALIFLIFQKT
jgi:hypothetical protein